MPSVHSLSGGDSGVRIHDQAEIRQQSRGVSRSQGYINRLLSCAAALAIDAHKPSVGVRQGVEDPILADRGRLEIEFDVANEILFPIIRGNNFDDQKRANV